MTNYVLKVQTGYINLSPVTFRLTARDFFKCYLDFEKPDRFSVVPFFLCCRALELAFKAIHLEGKSQASVKNLYLHDLVSSYFGLPPEKRSLSQEEVALLRQANKIYSSKEFEYINVFDPATGYARFPDIDALASVTRKVIGYIA